jgi:hypothetical protein
MNQEIKSELHQKNFFPNMEEIGEEIYVYRKFLSQEELDFYLNIITNQKKWIDGAQFNKPTIETFSDRIFSDILKKIQDTIALEKMFLENTPGITKIKPGYGMEEHSDDCPYCWKVRDPKIKINENENKRCVLYGIVVYFSNFTGGEIYYPEQNVFFKPEPGDLVMHATSKYCKHGVKPVIEGTRYSIAPYIVKYHSESDEKEAADFWNNYVKGKR